MGWARNQGLDRMTNAGRVTGIRDVTQGHGLDIKPYVARARRVVAGRGDRAAANDGQNAGVDLFYNPTPGAARQPDDQHRLRADRGRSAAGQPHALLRCSSRRSATSSSTAPRSSTSRSTSGNGLGTEQVQPFFSRRIGLSADGPAAADRRRHQVHRPGRRPGRRLPARPHRRRRGQTASSARTSRRHASSAGCCSSRTSAASTRGGLPATAPDGPSHTAGVDFRLATSRFRGQQNLNLTGWFLHAPRSSATTAQQRVRRRRRLSRTTGGTAASTSARCSATSTRRSASSTRRDYRRYNQFVGFGPRPQNSPSCGAVQFQRRPRAVHRPPQPDLLERDIEHVAAARSSSRARISVRRRRGERYERLDAAVSDQPRHHPAVRGRVQLHAVRGVRARPRTAGRSRSTAASRPAASTPVTATRPSSASPSARVPATSFSCNGEWNQVDLAEGSFTSNVFRVISDSQFSPYHRRSSTTSSTTPSAACIGWQSRLPVDHEAGKRPLHRLHAQLAGFSARSPIRDARPEVRVEGPLHSPLLT